ncbi:MAG: menaquinone biosynthesis decarboxylase [Bacteroidales bacterium]|jgi:4-hydroxy-3-polyprenylbenzoate decarboxylase
MSFKNLKQFIDILESENELARVKAFVNPELEIAEIADRVVKSNGKALLFENTGTDFPVLINAFGTEKRMTMALGVDKLDDVGVEMNRIFKNFAGSKNTFFNKIKSIPELINIASWLPKVKSGRGECQEIINKNPNLTKLPILKCWKHDGGRFITLPIVHTKDPLTGTRNTGMYRMQVFEKDLTAMHWHLHKGSAHHFDEYKKLKHRMPVAVALGGSPVYTYVATSPLPDNFDEYIFAGFLQKKKVELVKCITQDIEVPADVDFVIEGYIDPSEDFILEGPFGDHTGFYSLADYYPRFHVTCITHRKDAIYPATIVGIPPQEDAWLGKATERIFLNPIRMTIAPEIIDMTMPTEGVFHNMAIVKIKKTFEGQPQKVMNSLWGAGQMMFNKIMLVLNENSDLLDYTKIAQLVSRNVDIEKDIFLSKGPLDVLDHSSNKFTFGGKLGIDATNEREQIITTNYKLNVEEIKLNHPEIIEVNNELLKKNISVIFISVKKNKKNHLKELNEKLAGKGYFENIKFIVYIDDNVDIFSIKDIVWLTCNNIDASRDIYLNKTFLAIDGTRKTKEYDDFERNWPNIIVADDDTIKSIDEKWNTLGIGEFISSPSLKYKKMLFEGDAETKE